MIFALTVFSVRYRRSASNVAIFGFLVTLATALLVSWAQFSKTKPYTATFPYLSLSLTFTGATRYQNFELDLGFRLDHLALAALVVTFAVGLGCLIWHRAGGREEQGPVRFHAAMLLLGFAAAGVIVSPDLTELFAFWGMAGVASYLLVAHRWGGSEAGRIGQVALWLPFAGDLALLMALGLLWSRYGGPLTVDRLQPILHSTPGAGLKSLTTACLLILFAVVVRAGLAPFHAWSVGSRDAPPAGLAYMQAVWPLLAGLLLYRSVPLFLNAGPQALRVAAYSLMVCVGLSLVLALLGNDVRRAVSLAGAAAAGLLLFGTWQPAVGLGRGVSALTGGAALAGLLALGPGRAAVLLAVSSMSVSFRSFMLGDFGAGWARLPFTTLGLALGSLVISLSGVAAALSVAGGRRRWVFLVGLIGVSFVLWRVYAVAAHGPLRARRAFEPARVRELAGPMVMGTLLSAGLGLAAILLVLAPIPPGRGVPPALSTRWLDFLEGVRHMSPNLETVFISLLPPVAGAVVAGIAYTVARGPLLSLSGRTWRWFGQGWDTGLGLLARFLGRPGPGLVERIEVLGFGGAESGLATALSRAGRLPRERVPALSLVVAIAVLGVVVLALLSPGVHR